MFQQDNSKQELNGDLYIYYILTNHLKKLLFERQV